MLIREKLESTVLSNNEKEIAAYMLKEGVQIERLTIKQIAAATYTSPATAVRLAHKLGYDGWNELKEVFLEEQKYLESHFFEIDANYPFTASDSRMQIAGKLAALEKETLADTQALLQDTDLFAAVKLLYKAKIIYVFAVSSNIPLAQMFALNLSRFGRVCIFSQFQGDFQYLSRQITRNDCALIISYSGETPILVSVASYLKEQQIPMAALTNVGENSIAAKADAVLKIATREKLYSKIANFTTSSSTKYLLDVLFSCLMARDYDQNMAFRLAGSRQIEVGRFSTTSVLREEPAGS